MLSASLKEENNQPSMQAMVSGSLKDRFDIKMIEEVLPDNYKEALDNVHFCYEEEEIPERI